MRIALVCCFILLIFIDASHAQTRRNLTQAGGGLCSDEAPRVQVKLATAKTRYEKDLDATTLTQLHGSGGSGTTLGLAGGPIEITSESLFETRTRNGKSCVQLTEFQVLFWAKPVVLIASNFPRESCEYRAILAHEQDHIRILRKFVREFAPKLKRQVKDIVETSRTHVITAENNQESGQDQIQKSIINRLESYQNEIMPILKSRQAAIDTPEEYAHVQAQCDNWGRTGR